MAVAGEVRRAGAGSRRSSDVNVYSDSIKSEYRSSPVNNKIRYKVGGTLANSRHSLVAISGSSLIRDSPLYASIDVSALSKPQSLVALPPVGD